MSNDPNADKMSHELSKKEHVAEIYGSVKDVLFQLGIVSNKDNVGLNTVANPAAGFTIICTVEKKHLPASFPNDLHIIINPLHAGHKRELRVSILEAQELVFIDEHETPQLQLDTDDDHVFHVEEHLFIIELLDRLVALREKAYAGKIVPNK